MSTIAPHLQSVCSHDGVLILDTPRNQITTLNSTGSFIWRGLQQGKTVEQIIHDLSTETSTDTAVVARGVYKLLEQLRSHHLLES